MNPLNKDILRNRITEARKKKNLNQAQLAEKAGITPAAISQIEKGRRVPTIPVLHKIAVVLKVSLDYLTGNTEESELRDLLQNSRVQAYHRGFQSLNPNDQDTILKNIEFLQSQNDPEK